MQIAILDDYQSVALTMADWSKLTDRAEISVINDHVADEDVLAKRLAPFDILCIMRTPLRSSLIERLPKLKLIASTGPINAAVEVAAADRGTSLPAKRRDVADHGSQPTTASQVH